VATAQDAVDVLATNCTEGMARMLSLEQENTAFKGKVGGLESTVSGLESTVGGLESTVHELHLNHTRDITKLGSEKAALEGKVDRQAAKQAEALDKQQKDHATALEAVLSKARLALLPSVCV